MGFFSEDGQAGIVLGVATGTCFVDNMCTPGNEMGAAVAGMCGGCCSVSGVLLSCDHMSWQAAGTCVQMGTTFSIIC